MTRRGYPILGPVNVKRSDAMDEASKPVYLRYRILRGGLWAPEAGPGGGPETGPEAGPEGGPETGPEADSRTF